MKTRWMIVPLGLALLLTAKGFSAADKESGDKKFKATCPVSGKPAIEVVVRRNEGRQQGLLLLRELPEGVSRRTRRSLPRRRIANCSKPDRSCKSPAR